ncbi:MAG: tetratricopeptide repeat protein [Dehalococcoidia bacterium]
MPEELDGTAAGLNSKGFSLLEDGKLVEALDLFTRAIEADPNYSPSYLNRAECYRRLGREGDASRDEKTYNTFSAGDEFSASQPESRAQASDAQLEPTERKDDRAPSAQDTDPKAEDGVPERALPVQASPARIKAPGAETAESSAGAIQEEAEEKEESRWSPDSLLVTTRKYLVSSAEYRGRVRRMAHWGVRNSVTGWSVERLLLSLLLVIGLGVVGLLIARVSFCPEGLTQSFWTGCWEETLGFGLGGGVLGLASSLLMTRVLTR